MKRSAADLNYYCLNSSCDTKPNVQLLVLPCTVHTVVVRSFSSNVS